jgi:hypothetical protein
MDPSHHDVQEIIAFGYILDQSLDFCFRSGCIKLRCKLSRARFVDCLVQPRDHFLDWQCSVESDELRSKGCDCLFHIVGARLLGIGGENRKSAAGSPTERKQDADTQ